MPARFGIGHLRCGRVVREGRAPELVEMLREPSSEFTKNTLHGPEMSEALYRALEQDATITRNMTSGHVVQAINAKPLRIAQLLENMLCAGDDAVRSSAQFLFIYKRHEFTAPVRTVLNAILLSNIDRYVNVVRLILTDYRGENWQEEGLTALLHEPLVQALVVQLICRGEAHGFLSRYAEQTPAFMAQLNAAPFHSMHELDAIGMRWLAPTLPYEDAMGLRSISESLENNDAQEWSMYVTAISTAAACQYPVTGLMDESSP